MVAGHGLSERLVSVHVTGGQATDIFSDPAGVTARLLAAIERCVADGAEAVILGGAALAGQVPHLQPKAPVPLLDGIACATAIAELRVRLGVPASRVGALALPPRDSTNLSAPLAARLLGRA